MHSYPKSVVRALLGGSLILCSAGCRQNRDTPTAGAPSASANALVAKVVYTEADIVTLKLGLSPTSFHPSAIAVADKFGFYRAEGIRMQYVNVPPGIDPAIEALKKGEIDVFAGGTGHIDGFIDARRAGVKVKAVLAQSKGHPNFHHVSAWVTKDSPIKEAKDLVGKRIGGLATAGWGVGCKGYFWWQYLKKNGVDPSTVVNALVASDQQEQALGRNEIDVLTIDPIWQGDISGSGKYRLLWSSWEVTPGDVIDKQDAEISILGFTEAYIQQHPEVVRRYVRATVKAQAFTADNLENYVDWTSGGSAAEPKHDHRNLQVWSTGLIRPRALQKWIDWKVELGQLKQGDVKPEDLFTNEFNPYDEYKVNDPVAHPTYWDKLPKEFLYINLNSPKKSAAVSPSASAGK